MVLTSTVAVPVAALATDGTCCAPLSVTVVLKQPLTKATVAVVVVSGVAPLLLVLPSPLVGAVVALKVTVLPAVVATTGTSKVLLLPLLMAPLLTQVTLWPLVVQLQPLPPPKVTGALMPVGKVIVVVIGPLVGAVPWLATTTGRLLWTPTMRLGVGWPIVVVRSGAVVTLSR